MLEDVKIEVLKSLDKRELLDLFTQAFEDGHPLHNSEYLASPTPLLLV